MNPNTSDQNDTLDPCAVALNFVNVILLCLYSVLFFIAVGGNLLVLLVVLGQRRMRTVTNFFLLNLAIGDIAKALICIPFTFVVNVLVPYWPFGSFMCPFVLYMQTVVVFVSAFTLVAMSIDRYMAILHPLRQKLTLKQLIVTIIIVWTLALAVPLPTAFKSHLMNPYWNSSEECNLEMCIEDMGSKELKHAYTMTIMCLQYFVPLTVLMYTYSRIGYVIWIKTTPGEAERRRDERIASSKRKVSTLKTFEPRHDKMYVRPAKSQICLGIRPVRSETSLCVQWVAKDPSFLHADSEDCSD